VLSEIQLKDLLGLLVAIVSAAPALALPSPLPLPLPGPHPVPAPAPDLAVSAPAVLAVILAYLLARLVVRHWAAPKAASL